jgi:hypothetical protein
MKYYIHDIHGITRSPLKSHLFSDPRNSVSMKKRSFKLFINHGNRDDSFVDVIIHICMVFGYDLLCDLLEMLNLINIGSAVATRRNPVDPIQRTNMRGLMAETFESRWILFSFYFFPFFIDVFFNIIPFLFFNCDFFKFQNRLVQCVALVMLTGTKST